MTEDEKKALGLRALEAGFPTSTVRRAAYPVRCGRGALWQSTISGNPWPDFTDDATLGVLRGQVSRKWGPAAFIETGEVCYPPDMERSSWIRICRLAKPERRFSAPTEAVALVEALEAAP